MIRRYRTGVTEKTKAVMEGLRDEMLPHLNIILSIWSEIKAIQTSACKEDQENQNFRSQTKFTDALKKFRGKELQIGFENNERHTMAINYP